MKNKWVIGAVLAVVIVAGVVAAWRLTRPDGGAPGLAGKRIEAVFLAYGIRPETAELIDVGDTIYDETGAEHFKISGVSVKPAEMDSIDDAGVLRVVGHPVLKDVIITAQSIGPKVAWAYLYGRDKILAGANLALYGDNWKVWTRALTVTNLD
ncbi:MAG: DUF4330 family protein [Caldisericota bacterium]|nr:DUF4330 family protein [Caldisericota bacterium]